MNGRDGQVPAWNGRLQIVLDAIFGQYSALDNRSTLSAGRVNVSV